MRQLVDGSSSLISSYVVLTNVSQTIEYIKQLYLNIDLHEQSFYY